ncbi:MAG: DUF1207 domain-containing protein [Phycisphaeraceae bacterium]|nr:DUF1207 domain-containing protein [Phycisphaeraceae bacterium]
MHSFLNGLRQVRFATVGFALLVLLAFSQVNAQTAVRDDAFLRGYAAAVLEREFQLQAPSLTVQEGVVYVAPADLGKADPKAVRTALGSIAGVRSVEFEASPPPAAAVTPAAAPGAAAAGQANPPATQPTEEKATAEIPSSGPDLFPHKDLFDPLLADPRWPHFSVAFRAYQAENDFHDIGAVSFGETLPLYQDDAPHGRWGAILQGSVFGIFDLDSESADLVNADYWVGLGGTYRSGPFSMLGRVYHQSSHLGDEYLLRTGVPRVNLSYEVVDMKFSYDLSKAFRVYLGGGYMFDQEPDNIEPLLTQVGVEYRSPTKILGGVARPVGAVDVQMAEMHDWEASLSTRVGLQFENPNRDSHVIQLMLEYYIGHSPDGQFFQRTIQFIGLGLHMYF